MTDLSGLMQILQGGMNPQTLAQNIMQSNPRMQSTISQMQQQCGKQNPRDFVLNLCQQRGIPQNQVLQIANFMGLR